MKLNNHTTHIITQQPVVAALGLFNTHTRTHTIKVRLCQTVEILGVQKIVLCDREGRVLQYCLADAFLQSDIYVTVEGDSPG